MIAFPLFDLKESESKIIEEMCENIKSKKECIPEEDLDGVIIGMYLNIIEYIDSEKQYALKEMINVSGKIEGEFAKWKKEQKAEGIIEGEQNIIRELLNNHSIKEISKMIHKDETEIKKIIGID